MARIFVAVVTAVSVVGLSIYGLSFQHNATKSNLPSQSTAPAVWEAFNVTGSVSTESTAVLGQGLPLLAILVFLALIATMFLALGGGR